MDLKEIRYILAIARQGSIDRVAESPFISQSPLSKYLKNLENQLGGPLFYRTDNCYTPTYMGEYYLHYTEQITAHGEQWNQEYEDISHRKYGRLNIAIPIMMGSTLIQPTLMEFHNLYPHVTINVIEAVNFIAEASLKDHSIDLIFHNVHVPPKSLDYEAMQREEIVSILSAGHPLVSKAADKPGFEYPWIDLNLFSGENFILLYSDQNTGGIAPKLLKGYNMDPPVLLHIRNSEMSIKPAMEGPRVALAPESYYHIAASHGSHPSLCLPIGKSPIVTTTIAAYPKGRYLPQHARDYMETIREYCAGKR